MEESISYRCRSCHRQTLKAKNALYYVRSTARVESKNTRVIQHVIFLLENKEYPIISGYDQHLLPVRPPDLPPPSVLASPIKFLSIFACLCLPCVYQSYTLCSSCVLLIFNTESEKSCRPRAMPCRASIAWRQTLLVADVQVSTARACRKEMHVDRRGLLIG